MHAGDNVVFENYHLGVQLGLGWLSTKIEHEPIQSSLSQEILTQHRP